MTYANAGLLCLTPLSTIFQLYRGGQFYCGGQLYHGGQFYWWRKPSICRKSLTNFITQYCIEYTSPLAGFELTTLVAIGIDCIWY